MKRLLQAVAVFMFFINLIAVGNCAAGLPEVTSPFGWRGDPMNGERRFHAGVDFALEMDTLIVALFDGQVAEAEYQDGYGNEVLLYHPGNNAYTRYAHCNSLAVSPGEFVRAGELIGYVGSTGRSTGPHLHLEYIVRIDGAYQYANPLSLWGMQ